jgi:hypothetical protein
MLAIALRRGAKMIPLQALSSLQRPDAGGIKEKWILVILAVN